MEYVRKLKSHQKGPWCDWCKPDKIGYTTVFFAALIASLFFICGEKEAANFFWAVWVVVVAIQSIWLKVRPKKEEAGE